MVGHDDEVNGTPHGLDPADELADGGIDPFDGRVHFPGVRSELVPRCVHIIEIEGHETGLLFLRTTHPFEEALDPALGRQALVEGQPGCGTDPVNIRLRSRPEQGGGPHPRLFCGDPDRFAIVPPEAVVGLTAVGHGIGDARPTGIPHDIVDHAVAIRP